MEKFLFLHAPEHIAFIREKSELLPVLSYDFSEEDTGRILGWLKRREIKSYILFNRNVLTSEILAVSDFFDGIFIFSAGIAVKLRKKGYKGEIFLFSSGADVQAAPFFRSEKIRPVVFSSETYNSFEETGFKPLLLLTSKKCIADVGTCISTNGKIQDFTSCDIRCRIKCNERSAANHPFSLKPDFTVNGKESIFIYNERFSMPEIKVETKDELIDRKWNYTWPIGLEILAKAEKVGAETWLFKLNEKEKKAAQKGQIGIYCYNETIYNGEIVEPVKLNNFGTKVFAVIDMSIKQFEKVLLCVTRTTEEEKLFKNARHFIYTMPENASYIKSISEYNNEDVQVGGKNKVTAIIDDISKASIFRKGFINELVYDMPFESLPSSGNISWIVNWNNDSDLFEKIENAYNIKKIYSYTESMIYALKEKISREDVEFSVLPLYRASNQAKPYLLTKYLPIFISPYNTYKNKNYNWKSLKIFTKSRKNHTLFIENDRFFLEGNCNDLWVDIRNISKPELAAIKKDAETMKNSLKGTAGK